MLIGLIQKNEMKNKLIHINIICSLILQIVTILSGFIIPKVILSYFGSSVNGLVSSITQFLNYIQLLEGGLSGVIMAALYKPLSDANNDKISGIVKAAQVFFRKVGFIYIGYTVTIAFVYPLIIDTGFSYQYSIVLIFVLAINLVIQYFFSLSYKLLLNADRKVYIVSLTQILIVTINMIAIVVIAKFFSDILVIKLISGLVFLLQPFVFGHYVNKHYKLNKNVKPDSKAIEQRWDGFGINLAYFVHTNTDVIILSLFSTLTSVSVYSVYLMIVNAIKNLIISISQAIQPSFGKVLAENNVDKTEKSFDLYEFGISMITIFAFSCGIVLITPFVDLYTLGITDTNYHQVLFGGILCIAEMVYCLRDPYITATYAAGHFRQVSKYAYLEAIINIVISILLVRNFGIVGIAIGTTVSMIFRMIAHVIYLKNNILNRSILKGLKTLLMATIDITLIVFICNHIVNLTCTSYHQWIISAVETAVIAAFIIITTCILFYRSKLTVMLKCKKG